MISGAALFDEYPGPVLGHHPDLLFGLAEAAGRLLQPAPVRTYCPPTYWPSERTPRWVTRRSCIGTRLPGDPLRTRRNLRRACADARTVGCSLFLNLYLDETYESLPLDERGMKFVHVLHRPGELVPSGEAHQRLMEAATSDLFVVHTERGRRMAQSLLPGASIVSAPWPTATRVQVEERFAQEVTAGDEPYVLMIGGPRADKGIASLLEAIADGPRLRIVGEVAPVDEVHLRDLGQRMRVEWDRTWVGREVLEDAIRGAAVVVFPYLAQFAAHGGASGALAQATTFAKPLVVSEVLVADLPSRDGCIVVPSDDPATLRGAIGEALERSHELRDAASRALEAVCEAHTYEGHLSKLLSAATAS